jgi:glycosyltransferase involved in cell wall biosynthesis
VRPDISIIIPARNEGARVGETILAIARARATRARVEFVIVDDASTDDTVARLVSSVPQLLDERDIDIRLCSLEEHSGTYRARNWAARHASADILFTTDAHVRFSNGWDEVVFQHLQPNRILAGTIVDPVTFSRGYGCNLVVPFMATLWNVEEVDGIAPVQIAPCTATVLTSDLFRRIGGYDNGMLIYGAGEPEFSVRAWLCGAEIFVAGSLLVEQRFKPQDELSNFLAAIRQYWIHNCIRFGLLYMSELGCMQLLRFYARSFPNVFERALAMVASSDVWERRALLEHRLQYPFEWFVRHFGLRDQAGGEIL